MNGAAYLQDILHGFRMYKTLGDKAMAQVPSDADFDVMLDPASNSIAVLVQHISGNLNSRYRDFLTTDGEKADRDRDGEFQARGGATREVLVQMWDEGFAVALAAVEALTPDDLDTTITIRNQPMSVVVALNRSVTIWPITSARSSTSRDISRSRPAGGRRCRSRRDNPPTSTRRTNVARRARSRGARRWAAAASRRARDLPATRACWRRRP